MKTGSISNPNKKNLLTICFTPGYIRRRSRLNRVILVELVRRESQLGIQRWCKNLNVLWQWTISYALESAVGRMGPAINLLPKHTRTRRYATVLCRKFNSTSVQRPRTITSSSSNLLSLISPDVKLRGWLFLWRTSVHSLICPLAILRFLVTKTRLTPWFEPIHSQLPTASLPPFLFLSSCFSPKSCSGRMVIHWIWTSSYTSLCLVTWFKARLPLMNPHYPLLPNVELLLALNQLTITLESS